MKNEYLTDIAIMNNGNEFIVYINTILNFNFFNIL